MAGDYRVRHVEGVWGLVGGGWRGIGGGGEGEGENGGDVEVHFGGCEIWIWVGGVMVYR